jgi:long-chain acyl-CoA synthetase
MQLAVKTIGRIFLERIKKSRNKNSIGWIDNDLLKFYSFSEYRNIIECLSLALIKNGLKQQDKVCILANTCKEWHLMDMSILCSGGITVPIYHTYLKDEVKYIIEHSEASIIVVENDEQFEKVAANIDSLKNLKMVISISDLNESSKKKIRNFIPLYTYQDFLDLGSSEISSSPDLFEDRILKTSEDDIASIIYTSGTTGEPKGAVITHAAFSQMLMNVEKFTHNAFQENDRTLTFLPLSHVFGRCDSMLPLVFGWECVYAESIDKIIDNISIVKPTVMLAVPRIFEKIYTKIFEQMSNSSGITQKLFEWAIESGNNYFDKIEKDKSPTSMEILQYQLAYKLVFKKIYEKFGGRIRYFISGGAPLSVDIIKFLRSANLTILEGYGLTETVAPCCLNPLSRQVPGTVGQPMGDVEFKFADDGEILIRSNAIFSGYYNNPKETEKVLVDGWFYSGDIGHFTPEGYLKITDRKKDIIITSGGKNVAPQKIENLMKTKPFITHFAVFGDRKKYLVALVGIEKESFKDKYQEMGLHEDCTIKELAEHPMTKELIQEQVELVNDGLSSFETIKKFIIIKDELNTSNYLTPSLKVKKKLLLENYQEQIDALYKE